MKIKDLISNSKKNRKLAVIILVLVVSMGAFTLFFIRSFDEITKPVYDAFRKKSSRENKETSREPAFSLENTRDLEINPVDKLSPEALSRKSSEIPADVIKKENFSETTASFRKLEGTGVTFASYTANTSIANPVKFSWQTYADTENTAVEKTFICWSKKSIGEPALDKYVSFSNTQQGSIDKMFTGAPEFSSAGTYYLRAFARIEGGDYWSDEIEVLAAR